MTLNDGAQLEFTNNTGGYDEYVHDSIDNIYHTYDDSNVLCHCVMVVLGWVLLLWSRQELCCLSFLRISTTHCVSFSIKIH